MLVSQAIGRALVDAGVGQVFGVVGSGNFHVTAAMTAAGARFTAARHEGGAATMADAYARTSGEVTALSVHQGCGLTNAMTGLAEAAKSRTPLVVLAPEATSPTSNFAVDQGALAAAVGAVPMRITSPEAAVAEALAAVRTARHERRTVVLNLPLDVQGAAAPDQPAAAPVDGAAPVGPPEPVQPTPDDVEELARLLAGAERPVFIAGRGARSAAARDALAELAGTTGALLATSAVARGLFHDEPFDLDVSGGFATPLAAELISAADLVVGWGCALNMWTTRHGRLLAPSAAVVQVDDTAEALGVHRELTLGVVGDVAVTASAVTAAWPSGPREGYRTAEVRRRLAEGRRWQDVEHTDLTGSGRIDPRTLSTVLDELLPDERVVAVDSGNFMGYPSMYLQVPDEAGFCFTQAFQSVGLGLATGIGAALARPDRLPVVALGDGGALMGAAELETVARLGLPMVIVVYNDDAYGAEVHHFHPHSDDRPLVTFPPTDLAAVARGYGFTGVTVRSPGDLTGLAEWLDGPRSSAVLIDAKVVADEPSWWLEEAFRGH